MSDLRRLVAVAAVAAVVVAAVGLGPVAGAELAGGTAAGAWTPTCVASGTRSLPVWGQGFGAGSVALRLAGPDGGDAAAATVVASARGGAAAGRGAVLVTALALPDGLVAGTDLTLTASQADHAAPARTVAVRAACPLSLAARIDATPCADPGRSVPVTLRGSGADAAAYGPLVHHLDLFGPSEVVGRDDPPHDGGSWSLVLAAPTTPGRTVVAAVEAPRSDGTGTEVQVASVVLPPRCTTPASTTTSPPTTAPGGPTTTTSTLPAVASTPIPPATTPRPPALASTPIVPRLPGGAPAAAVRPTVAQAGQVVVVAATGLPASAPATLRWRPGVGSWTTRVRGDGSLSATVLVLPGDVAGPRRLEVVAGGRTASATLLVAPSADEPGADPAFRR